MSAPKGIPFIKMHGIGNDFIVIDDLNRSPETAVTPEFGRKICDRRFGVGADQILWLRKPQGSDADARMEIVNSDGSTAEMCGNGIRAVALYLYKDGPRPNRKQYVIETMAGLKTVEVRGDQVSVDMGPPTVSPHVARGGEQLVALGEIFQFHEVGMGNPHAVIFVPDVAGIPLEKFGPEIETHPRFPKKTNVEFVQVINSREIKVRVWERGAGVTLACGTGACASAVAALASGRVQGEVAVHLPGGTLQISWAGDRVLPSKDSPSTKAPVIMKGPATEVFRGESLG